MSALSTIVIQLVLLALGAGFAVLAASSARRAASFDILRDFDALAHAVTRLQAVARSEKMTRVRAAALEPRQEAHQVSQQTSLTHEQLRALVRARRNGVTQ
jgi:hypothetical protein